MAQSPSLSQPARSAGCRLASCPSEPPCVHAAFTSSRVELCLPAPPGAPVAPGHAEDDGVPQPPGEPPVDRDEQALPEQPLQARPPDRAWPPQVPPGQVGLGGLEQVL